MSTDERVEEMCRVLRSGANADGGWGYYPGKASRLEATCWAILALRGADGSQQPLTRPAAFIQSIEGPDGLLNEAAVRAEARPNLGFNGIAALTLAAHRELGGARTLTALLAAITQHRGVKLPQSNVSPQDNSLQAWAWIDSTFSWVEPTCWCTLALKKAAGRAPDALSRIDEAERLLRDRSCAAGGWNAGTASVLGQGLNPHVPTTALGVMALQDRRNDPVFVRAAAELARLRLSERSAMALGLTLIASNLTGSSVDDLRDALIAQWERTTFLGNLHLTAIAVYSLTHERHGSAAFKI
jgi:hypothetical protein